MDWQIAFGLVNGVESQLLSFCKLTQFISEMKRGRVDNSLIQFGLQKN